MQIFQAQENFCCGELLSSWGRHFSHSTCVHDASDLNLPSAVGLEGRDVGT